jgi:hypothetical protein
MKTLTLSLSLSIGLLSGGLLSACDKGDEPIGPRQACIDDNASGDPEDYESDDQSCAAEPGGGDEECPPYGPTEVAEECEEDGNPCDADSIMTRQAAVCIAELDELAPGINEWRANLVYNYGFDRPIWSIDNTLTESDCSKDGEGIAVDAITGELLERYNWGADC